jgi:hypothetical protein
MEWAEACADAERRIDGRVINASLQNAQNAWLMCVRVMVGASDPGPLCRALAGVDEINDAHASRVMGYARVRFGDYSVNHLEACFASGGLAAIQADERAAGIARSLVYALYVGLLPDEAGKEVERHSSSKPPVEDPRDYFESVVWRVIYAHPRGLTGGYFGHWHYPPEVLDG